jgi:hypothetical protein
VTDSTKTSQGSLAGFECRSGALPRTGQEFLRANVVASLYRLPTLSYSHSFPVLLADGVPSEAEARAVTQSSATVETLNRGLDQANEARMYCLGPTRWEGVVFAQAPK